MRQAKFTRRELARLHDAQRQAELAAHGERVLRVTSAQIEQPRMVFA
jgi:very-short-patch-repair endonuclease